ncbi:GNAT family N-acetyltransferase [Leptotrichia trevisanii]|uniref:GNAT family N-acetyltransferase n=1 Tax=Leptotrichia trevisanii TaxID=109328 RepID=UPI001E633834|nr:GNAT family N-acetyltransferase [Leptotrichia trevisanii]
MKGKFIVMKEIRLAQEKDIPKIENLLEQILLIHHEGRPDIFKANGKKYTAKELTEMLNDSSKPIFVATDEKDNVIGYIFCIFKRQTNHNVLTDIKTLFIDDLCVDESTRGQNIGKKLYDFALDFAKKEGCYNLTLDAWANNTGAVRFYERLGMKVQKYVFEEIL